MKNGSFSLKNNSLLKTQFDILFSNSWWLISGQVLLSITMLAWLWGILDQKLAMVWFFLSLTPPFYRAFITHHYTQNNKKNLYYWRNRYLAGSVIYGIIWGVLIFSDLSTTNFYFICFVFGGLMAVTIGSSSTYIPAVLSFIFPIAFLVSIKCLLLAFEHPEDAWIFAFLLVVFAFLVMLISTKNLNKAIISGLKLRFENIELVKTLQAQKSEVEAAKEIAEKANADKSRFLAAASHDLRQPLHAMSLFLDAIRHCDEKQERLGLYEKLEKSVESLGDLFNALLDISKIDADVIDIQPTTFYVADIMRKVVNEFEIEAKKKGLSLAYRSSTLKAYSDPLWCERIIRNLVSNAIRYTDSGKVLLTCRKKGINCCIQVWDTGQGIVEEKQDIIFQEFTQLHNPQRDRNNGLGLGLAIVKRLCALLKHNITVSSLLDKGSVFSLTLPLSSLSVINHEVLPNITIENVLKHKSILIIDDEPDVRIAMAAMLEKWGCHVLVADSLTSVFTQLETQKTLPSLIISDYRLEEEKTGLEALIAINQRFNVEIPAILVTGETEINTIRKINNSGYKVLHKPVKPAKLRLTMNGLID
jgi:signal transduction histidine kinase